MHNCNMFKLEISIGLIDQCVNYQAKLIYLKQDLTHTAIFSE